MSVFDPVGLGKTALKDIVSSIFGGASSSALKSLGAVALDRAVASMASKEVAHATMKQVENTLTTGPGTLDQRIAIVDHLIDNFEQSARNLTTALHALRDAQVALEHARNTPGEDAARQVRETAENIFARAYIDLAKLA